MKLHGILFSLYVIISSIPILQQQAAWHLVDTVLRRHAMKTVVHQNVQLVGYRLIELESLGAPLGRCDFLLVSSIGSCTSSSSLASSVSVNLALLVNLQKLVCTLQCAIVSACVIVLVQNLYSVHLCRRWSCCAVLILLKNRVAFQDGLIFHTPLFVIWDWCYFHIV